MARLSGRAAELVARIVAWAVERRPGPRDFVADCCHRIDGRLRAGPPAYRPPERS